MHAEAMALEVWLSRQAERKRAMQLRDFLSNQIACCSRSFLFFEQKRTYLLVDMATAGTVHAVLEQELETASQESQT
jgi:hypothetical protein